MTKKIEQINLNDSLKKLSGIVSWFENQSEVDVEKALQYVKEGVELIKSSKDRLKEIENEFVEIKKNLTSKEA